MKQKKLFEQFPPVTRQEWMDKINADLKGADFNKKLVWKSGEGFDVMPFYLREDMKNLTYIDAFLPLYLRGDVMTNSNDRGVILPANRWLVRQNINVSDYSAANKKAVKILQKGIDSIGFIIGDPESINDENLTLLLDGINPDSSEINFLSEGRAREIISSLIRISGNKGFDKSTLRGAVEADPLGRLMINGTLCIPVEAGFDYLAALTKETSILPNYRNIQVNGSNFTNAGSSTVQELGFSISMATEYLAQLTDRGISVEDAASMIRFSFGIGSDYFMEIAKLRAARILWEQIADAYNVSDKKRFRMEIHSVTKVWNDTIDDPYINMLRTQTEAMSAVLGGTDSLTVNPFDITINTPDEFSERMARNQQLILKEESWFDKVADPSAGSYYIENLTALIAENSWRLFLRAENLGGFIQALNSGFVRREIAGLPKKR